MRIISMLVAAMMAGVAIAAEFKSAEPVWPKGWTDTNTVGTIVR